MLKLVKQKMEEANFARIQGSLAKMEARQAIQEYNLNQ
jgi:hypothetical protein